MTTAINVNWPRWIKASISKHFVDTVNGDLTVFVEGTNRNTKELKNFCEVRLDGPLISEISKGNMRIYIEINCLIQTTLDSNLYQHSTNIGEVMGAFTAIKVYKYGSEAGDDASYVGCLGLLTDHRGKEGVQTYNFGQVDPSLPLFQASVEGHYRMFLIV